MKPPQLPSEVLRRVVRVSRIDGISVLLVSGFCALVSAAWRDPFGAVIGLGVAAAGTMEMHGATLLRSGKARGMSLLFRSHMLIGACMITYIAVRLYTLDIPYLHEMLANAGKSDDAVRQSLAQVQEQLQEEGTTLEQALLGAFRLTCYSLGLATVLYQGGMMLYYKRRRAAVMAAIQEEDPT